VFDWKDCARSSASVALPMALYKYVYDYDMILTHIRSCFLDNISETVQERHIAMDD